MNSEIVSSFFCLPHGNRMKQKHWGNMQSNAAGIAGGNESEDEVGNQAVHSSLWGVLSPLSFNSPISLKDEDDDDE